MGNGGAPVARENTEARQGQYREVMYLRSGCTGTVVAPYTVMSASHCFSGRAGDEVSYNDSGTAVADVGYRNPYIYYPYVPAWWDALNTQQQQNGGRMDDWPAQHDQALLFVPAYTPEFLRSNGIEPAAINPYEQDIIYQYHLVGVGSTGGQFRDSISTSFLPATANSITQEPRDGYLTRSSLMPWQGTATGGDSGGPTLGSSQYQASTTEYFEGPRHMVGTTQNQFDMAPLAHDPGIFEMTPNQRHTVRLNTLWAQARIDDIDNDNLVGFCDPSPGTPTAAESSRCPDAVGAPKDIRTTDRDIPLAALTCKPGYVADGYRGGAGYVIDRLAVRCRALSCYDGGGADCDAYWTDHFGGDGGSPFEATCSDGEVLIGLWGKEVPNVELRQFSGLCTPYVNVRVSSYIGSHYVGTIAGNDFGRMDVGDTVYRWCSSGLALSGFQARSTNLNLVTGLQPVCMDLSARTAYVGGHGGQQVSLSCPKDYVATGTLQNETEAGTVNGFGLVCSPRYRVTDGLPLDPSQQVVIHGTAWNYALWSPLPAMQEPRQQVHMPQGTYERTCNVFGNTFGLSGLVVEASSLIDRISYLHCTNAANNNERVYAPVRPGEGNSGYYLRCPAGQPWVKGMTARTGWLLDGLALECTS